MNSATNAVQLASGDWRVSLRPDLGACLESAYFRDHAALRSSAVGALQHVRLSACYPLIPFSNRIADAKLHWNGCNYALHANFPGEAHAIHGVGWQRAWQVQEQTEDFCLLGLDHDGQQDWPFAFSAKQSLRLCGPVMELTLTITNQSTEAAPVGLGWHPYFCKRSGAQLDFAAQKMWLMGADRIPCGDQAHAGLQQAVADLSVDHCFSGWSGLAVLQGDGLRCELRSDMEHLVVYTDPSKNFIAIEPVSHVNNAMNAVDRHAAQAKGVRVLPSGQSWQVSMSISGSLI